MNSDGTTAQGTQPMLDYGVGPPNARAKWVRRVALALLVVTVLYTAPMIWLYRGWRQETPARQMVARVGGIRNTKLIGPAFVGRVIPERLQWLRERITGIALNGRITSDDLRTLQPLHQLEILILAHTRVEDDDLAQLKGLSGLQSLSLFGTQVGDAGLVYIGGLTRLRELDLTRTRVTDAGLVHLKGMGQLQLLSLCDTTITDGGLVCLEGLTALQRLSLIGTGITDAGLVHLKGLTNLQLLSLSGTHVTDPGVANLHKGLPNCEFIAGPFWRWPSAGAGANRAGVGEAPASGNSTPLDR